MCRYRPGLGATLLLLPRTAIGMPCFPLAYSVHRGRCRAEALCRAVRRCPITDTVAMFLFTLDIWTRFNAGLVIRNNLSKAMVMDRLLVAEQYVLRGPFVFDILSTVPLWIQVSAPRCLGKSDRRISIQQLRARCPLHSGIVRADHRGAVEHPTHCLSLSLLIMRPEMTQ